MARSIEQTVEAASCSSCNGIVSRYSCPGGHRRLHLDVIWDPVGRAFGVSTERDVGQRHHLCTIYADGREHLDL